MARSLKRLGIGALLIVPLLPLTACQDAAGNVRVVGEADLPASHGVTGAQWQSGGINDEWMGYPAQTALELGHSLGREPVSVLVYVAFDAGGQDGALAAGDIARIAEVSDDTVTIRNGTNQDFFARIVLQ